MNAQLVNDPMVSGVAPRPAAVATPRQPLPRPLAPVGTNSVERDGDGGRLSSDAGVVLRKDLADPRGLPRALAAGLSDPREGRRLHCTPEDVLKPRLWPMAAGAEDANDATTLRDDPIWKRRRARLPATGAPVASPPTIARFANRLARRARARLALVWREPCRASSASPPSVIVLDVEDPEDPVHGEPEQARDEGDDGGECLRPLPL